MPEKKNNQRSTEIRGRQVPNNYEAEQALLGAMLMDADVVNEVIADINADDFYYESHRLIFNAVKDLSMANQPIDIVTLSDKLSEENLAKIGGIMYVNELMNVLPSTANFGQYLGIVKRDGKLRRIIRNAERIIENTYGAESEDMALAFAEKMIYSISEEGETSELVSVKETAFQVVKKFQDILSNPNANLGLLTHFRNLDEITHGYLPGQLIVIAARPGCGKTTFALNIVGNIAARDKDKKIAVFNLEMNRNEVTERLMVGMAKVKLEDMLTAKCKKEDYERICDINKLLADSNVYIDDTAKITPEQIMSKCRRLAQQKGGLDLVVIDYLQLLESSDRKRESSKQQEVADISRAMKIMAKELQVPVILLSQMSRDVEKRDDKTPKLSDLRESGAIEQDADQVYFLSRPDKKSDDDVDDKFVDLIIAKHRAGSTGTIYFKFENEMLKFVPAKEKSRYIEKNSAENAKKDDAEEENVSEDNSFAIDAEMSDDDIERMASMSDESMYGDFDSDKLIGELNASLRPIGGGDSEEDI